MRFLSRSDLAMAYRLQRLGLLRSKQMDCPNFWIDILVGEEEAV